MAEANEPPMHSTYMDYPEHERTYRAFTFGAKWGTAVVAVIVFCLVVFVLV